MQQYFIKQKLENPITITDKETLKHMFAVMRLSADDEVILVFEDGIKRLARVTDSEQHQFELVKDLDENAELPIEVTIAMGFPKGDKLDLVAQKGTELGMANLWAYPADWSVVKWDKKKLTKRQEKLEKIVQGAAEQSKRNHLPSVQFFATKDNFMQKLAQFDLILVAYEESAKTGEHSAFANALQQIEANSKVLLIFGPEGGISSDEIAAYQKAGGLLVGLGPRILRTETAPLYALSAISYALELNR